MSLTAPRRLTYVRLPDLRHYMGNSKKHVTGRLVASLERWGWTNPVLVCERRQELAAGHGRVEAAVEMKHLGRSMPDGLLVDDDGEWLIPVTRGWSSKNDTEFRAYVIADNKLSEDGGWDNAQLIAELEEVLQVDAALFDELAFSHEEMDDLMRFTGDQPTAKAEKLDVDAEKTTDDQADATPAVDSDDQADEHAAGRTVICPSCSFVFSDRGR